MCGKALRGGGGAIGTRPVRLVVLEGYRGTERNRPRKNSSAPSPGRIKSRLERPARATSMVTLFKNEGHALRIHQGGHQIAPSANHSALKSRISSPTKGFRAPSSPRHYLPRTLAPGRSPMKTLTCPISNDLHPHRPGNLQRSHLRSISDIETPYTGLGCLLRVYCGRQRVRLSARRLQISKGAELYGLQRVRII